MGCFLCGHEDAFINFERFDGAFLSVRASVRERKSHITPLVNVSGASLMLFSTGFGFWGLARTGPQFIFPE